MRVAGGGECGEAAVVSGRVGTAYRPRAPEKGNRGPDRMRARAPAAEGRSTSRHPQPTTRYPPSAKRLSERVRHHRVHATEPDPNRRGEAARLARSANPTRGRRGRRTPHNGRDAVAPLGKTSHWPWIDVPVIGSVSFHRIRAALQEDQYDTNRGPPRGGLPPFSRFASILNKLGAAYRRG